MRSFIGEIGMSRSNNRSCSSGVLTRRNRKNLLWFINGQSVSLRHYMPWGRLCRTITTGCYIPIYHQITVLSVRARSAHIFSSWLISTRKLIASREKERDREKKGTCCRLYMVIAHAGLQIPPGHLTCTHDATTYAKEKKREVNRRGHVGGR